MAVVDNRSVVASGATVMASPGSYVEWGAVLAGAVVALAVSFVLLSFGASVGLSAVSPWTSSSGTVKAVTFGSVLWMILSYIWAFSLGGYLSGRMRHRWSSVQSEVEFRDGAHGLLVWATAVALGAIVATSAATSITRGATSALGSIASRAADPMAREVDSLFRAAKPAPAGAQNANASDDYRAETARILLNGELSAPDRTYLAQLIAARTGLSQADAEKRLSETIDEAKRAADRARKIAVVFGFLTAATLLISGAAAWASAEVGGNHRDANKYWAGLSRESWTRRS